jgi:exosortase
LFALKNTQTSPAAEPEADRLNQARPMILIPAGLSLALVIWFYGFVARFGIEGSLPLFGWLMRAWNAETGLEHGLLLPLMTVGLIAYRFKDLRDAAGSGLGNYLGLIAVLFGALFYVVSYRLHMPRIAAVGLPLLLWGACHFLWGWRAAKILFIPLFIFWLAVPLPSLQNAMLPTRLLILSLARWGSSLCGVETTVMGTMIFSVSGNWQPFEFGMGCSDEIYALMPLLTIYAGWAYVAKIRMWQKAALFLAALPIAITGNVLRLVSIFVIADHGNAKWAATVWYDWSGLLIVYSLSLISLLVLHSIFLGRLPWKKAPQEASHGDRPSPLI